MKIVEFGKQDKEILTSILEKLGNRSFVAVSYDKERGAYQHHRYNMTPETAVFCMELMKAAILRDDFE